MIVDNSNKNKINQNIAKKVSVSKNDRFKWLYYYKVWEFTELNASLSGINSQRNKKYSLDHIIPIKIGFENCILPEIIGGLSNIRIICYKENLKKNARITKEVLEKSIEINVRIDLHETTKANNQQKTPKYALKENEIMSFLSLNKRTSKEDTEDTEEEKIVINSLKFDYGGFSL